MLEGNAYLIEECDKFRGPKQIMPAPPLQVESTVYSQSYSLEISLAFGRFK